MKKVIIFNKNLKPGGAERQLCNIAKLLKAIGVSVTFLVLNKEGELVQEIEDNDFNIDILPCKDKGIWKSSRMLRNYIKYHKADVLLSFLPESNIVSTLAGFPKKNWKTITGARSSNPAFLKNKKLKIYYWAHLFDDAVITNSETNKRNILKVNKLLNPKKVHVVYNLVKVPEINSIYEPFKDDKIHVVVAANYRKVKNVFNVIEAISNLSPEEKKRICVDWYGLPIEYSLESIKDKVKEKHIEENFIAHGSTRNVLEKYHQGDVVGLFSNFEGFPNAICEAMFVGKFIICTPVSDIPSLLQGTNNVLCQDSSALAISTAFKKLISSSNDQILKVGKDNKALATSLFDNEKISNQLKSIVLQ